MITQVVWTHFNFQLNALFNFKCSFGKEWRIDENKLDIQASGFTSKELGDNYHKRGIKLNEIEPNRIFQQVDT